MKNLITIITFLSITFASITTTQAQVQPRPTPTMADNPNQADIKFEKETHDFGVIPEGIPVTYTFALKNTGKEPLIITSASASCGCVTPDWSKEPIKPGKEGFVKATYNAASPGDFTKSVTITSNAKKSTVVIYLKGTVKPKQ